MRKKQINIRPPLKESHKQPRKCEGCIWGRWEGTAQFCSRSVCQRKKSRTTDKYYYEAYTVPLSNSVCDFISRIARKMDIQSDTIPD